MKKMKYADIIDKCKVKDKKCSFIFVGEDTGGSVCWCSFCGAFVHSGLTVVYPWIVDNK